MKTPRDLLLRKHGHTEPKLDELREQIVRCLNNRETKQPRPGFVSLFLDCLKNFRREIIWPARRIWIGLAAAWLFILVGQFSLYLSARPVASVTAKPSRDFLPELREKQQLMAELTGRPKSKPTEANKPSPPQPRSDLGNEIPNV